MFMYNTTPDRNMTSASAGAKRYSPLDRTQYMHKDRIYTEPPRYILNCILRIIRLSKFKYQLKWRH
jgi:hypothetical protein